MKELLFEIGTEEIPSSYIVPAVEALRDSIEKRLGEWGLTCGDIKIWSTPRRLAISVMDIPAEQPKRISQVFGPPKKAAFAPDGTPTKAAIGFAKGKGLDPSALRIGETEKGEYIYVEIEEGGANTKDLLAGALAEIVQNLPFPKSMRWGSSDLRFTRPIHWIVAMFGGEVMEMGLGGVRAGSVTRGHRFMGSQSIEVTGRGDYETRLKENFVITDLDRRKHEVIESARAVAEANGLSLYEDDALAATVACLTEWPIALWGSFNKEYLALPDELLIESMKVHQKMFAIKKEDGSLANGFIGVSNMKVNDDSVVIAGYQRVLAARLADAKFFFDEDRKHSLESFANKLSGVVYQKKLGTVGGKIERFTRLAEWLAGQINPGLEENTITAAKLCKADLETLMVYEFPELQGVMGREYARHEGQPAEVCEAIFEHYKPRWSGDDPPSSDIGAIIGIADKMDTLAGCFGIGLIPTGTADPFALRRNALGIIQTFFAKEYPVSLGGLIEESIAGFGGKLESQPGEVKEKLLEFFAGRLKNYWTGQGVTYDVADAVLAAGFDDLAVAGMRCKAMAELKKRDFFGPLAITFKRAANITKDHSGGEVDESLFESGAERDLRTAVNRITGEVEKLVEAREFLPALEKIAGLRDTVDKFFDEVMVMDENEKIRENRLNLLGCLTILFKEIADFSKLVA